MISKSDLIHIFIQCYSKSLYNTYSIFYKRNIDKIKKYEILNELSNLVFTHFITTINNTNDVNFLIYSTEYVVRLYIEYINQSMGERFSKFMKNTHYECIAKEFCLEHISKKFKHKVNSSKYSEHTFNMFLSLRTKIDLYFYRRFDDLMSEIEMFYTYCKILAKTFCLKYIKLDTPISLVDLDNQVGLVQDLLTFHKI